MFENCKFIINNEQESRDAQAALFNLGYLWLGKPGYMAIPYGYPNVIYVTEGKVNLNYSSLQCSEYSSEYHGEDYTYAHLAHLLATHKPAPSGAGSLPVQGMLDKMEGDGDIVAFGTDKSAWTPHTGNKCPVAEGTLVDVQYRDGQEVLGVPAMLLANSARDASPAYWRVDNEFNDIVEWRLAVSQEAVADADGWTEWNGGKMPVAGDVLVDVIIDGDDSHPCCGRRADDWSWEVDDCPVTSYRVWSVQTIQGEDEWPAPCMLEMPPSADTATPDTNPKRQYGMKSIPLNLWSPLATAYGAVALYNGSLAYGQGNYKATPVEASIYIAAGLRHFIAWAEGQEFDPKDGVPNLAGVLANVAILLDARATGMLIDDRQIPSGYLKEIEALKEIVANLQVLHAGKNPRHYTIADSAQEGQQ